MSDDPSSNSSKLYGTLSRSFARLTHFIDENIRVIQYGVYCTGAIGVVVCLHSVRAFTKFSRIQDIPKEFITKHLRLHGNVRWIGLSPPSAPVSSPHQPTLALAGGVNISEKGSKVSEALAHNDSSSPTVSAKLLEAEGKENENFTSKGKPKSLSADNRGIYDGAGELHPWDDGIDPDVTRIEYEEELLPIYLQLDHTPAVPFLRQKTTSLLSVQLADVEVSKLGFQHVKKELMNQRAWFTLVSHDTDYDCLNAWVKPAKFLHRRSINEQLLRKGFALAAPMDLDLHDDKQYVKQYMKFLEAQEYAEKKKVGLWTPPPKEPSAASQVFKKVISRLRAVIGRKK